jgi:hypothetical protein
MKALLKSVAMAGLLVVGAGQAAVAFPAMDLNLGLPDLMSGFVQIDYSSGQLSANGYPEQLKAADGTISSIPSGYLYFSLMADLDINGVLSGGSMSISKTFSGLQYLTADLTQFGVNGSGSGTQFQFLCTITGGSYASYAGGVGETLGIILAGTGNNGVSFDRYTGNDGLGTADVGRVPDSSSTITLLLMSCIAVILLTRRVAVSV